VSFVIFWCIFLSPGARGGTFGWGTVLQAGRQRVRSAFFIDLNPSGRTMTLGLTQPLNEMSTRNISREGGGVNFGASPSWKPQGLSRSLQGLLYLLSYPLLPFISPLIVTLFSLDFICFSPILLCPLSSCSMFLWPVIFRYSLKRTEYKPKFVGMRERKTGTVYPVGVEKPRQNT